MTTETMQPVLPVEVGTQVLVYGRKCDWIATREGADSWSFVVTKEGRSPHSPSAECNTYRGQPDHVFNQFIWRYLEEGEDDDGR